MIRLGGRDEIAIWPGTGTDASAYALPARTLPAASAAIAAAAGRCALHMMLTGARPSICLSRSRIGRRNGFIFFRLPHVIDGQDDHRLDARLADPLRRDQFGKVQVGVKRIVLVEIGEAVALKGRIVCSTQVCRPSADSQPNESGQETTVERAHRMSQRYIGAPKPGQQNLPAGPNTDAAYWVCAIRPRFVSSSHTCRLVGALTSLNGSKRRRWSTRGWRRLCSALFKPASRVDKVCDKCAIKS